MINEASRATVIHWRSYCDLRRRAINKNTRHGRRRDTDRFAERRTGYLMLSAGRKLDSSRTIVSKITAVNLTSRYRDIGHFGVNAAAPCAINLTICQCYAAAGAIYALRIFGKLRPHNVIGFASGTSYITRCAAEPSKVRQIYWRDGVFHCKSRHDNVLRAVRQIRPSCSAPNLQASSAIFTGNSIALDRKGLVMDVQEIRRRSGCTIKIFQVNSVSTRRTIP
jgi:hypothetical protein